MAAARYTSSSRAADSLRTTSVASHVPAMSGWRREVFGDLALKLKHGEIALKLDRGAVQIVEIQK